MAKRIVILGAGESGAGAAVLAKKKGFDTFVSDMSSIKDKYKEMLNERNIPWEEGKHTEELILNADEVIKSPGIPNDAPMVVKLREKGTPIISEIEFAGRYTNAKMICITGSNGKTTTTSLIYHIFKKAGLNVGLAGNIGQSLAYQVAEYNYDYYVIELSSFQLDNMYKFHANIAVLMNITPDHLDRYEHKMQNYVDAKFRIIQNQTDEDAFIYWSDDPIIQRELHKYGIHGHYYPFAEHKKDGLAAFVDQKKVYFTEPIAFNMEEEELALTGTHNLFNSMAAGISANIAGIRKECIREALKDFKGVEHRLEKVARVRGYRWRVCYSQQELSELIHKRSGIEFGKIIDLIPVERGTSGRLVRLKIVGTLRTLIIGKELEIRRTLSSSHLYSSAFVVDKEYKEDEKEIPSRFILTGSGWGHGVGLCQIGAAVMGEQGYKYKEILSHYYPGSAIEQQYK